MFHCLPSNIKCEWKNLSGFVDNYNHIFSTNYSLSECLDVYPNGRRNPEFRLKSPGHRDIVLEHKIIPWPPDYLRNHRIQHDFMESITDNLKAEFTDELYVLRANAEDLVPIKRKIENWTRDISRQIISKREEVDALGHIAGSSPIPWRFHRITAIERDDDMPEKGIGIHLHIPSNFSDFSDEDEKEMSRGIRDKFIDHLQKTVEKFDGYDECIKIFVTELYSDNYMLSHELIEVIARGVSVPECIDQIWVGHPVWVNETESITGYKEIKFK